MAHSRRFLETLSEVFASAGTEHLRPHRGDFQRNGALSPALLTTLLLYMVADGNRRGYRHLLDAFWDEALSFGLELPTEKPISGPSFCAARPKITSELLKHMIHVLAGSHFEKTFGSDLRWHGRRVFALDGTKINLQRAPDLKAAYGVPDSAHCPQILLSVLLDVCAKAPVDLEVSRYRTSEREHLLEMLPSLEAGDVLVLDRGYPSHEVIQHLAQCGIDFLIRVPSSSTFSAIDELRRSKESDAVVEIVPPPQSPPEWTPLTLRVVRLPGPDGTESFFLTSLEQSEFGALELRELYHMRWEAEEFYKLLKSPYIGQGQFRSKSPEGIRQEVHAQVLYLAIARVLMGNAAEAEQRDYSSLSPKSAVLGLADYVVRILLHVDRDTVERQVQALLRRIVRTRDRRRRGRSHPRVSYRPRLRWGPTGRVGG